MGNDLEFMQTWTLCMSAIRAARKRGEQEGEKRENGYLEEKGPVKARDCLA
jgi:hypothetical protein